MANPARGRSWSLAKDMEPEHDIVNRVAQYSYRWHPSYRQMPSRIAQLGRDHDVARPDVSDQRA